MAIRRTTGTDQRTERIDRGAEEDVAWPDPSVVFEAAPVATLLVDREWRVRRLNRAVVEFTGRDCAELLANKVGEVFRCVFLAEDPRGCGYGSSCKVCSLRNLVLDAFGTENVHYREKVTLFIESNGRSEENCFLVSAVLVKVTGSDMVLAFLEDVTRRGHAENELLEVNTAFEKGLEEVIRNLPVGILVLDAERRVLLANPAAADLLPEPIGVCTGEAVSRLGQRSIEEVLGQETGMDLEVQLPEQRQRVYTVSAIHLAEAQGWQRANAMVLIQDITETRERQLYAAGQDRLAAVGQLVGGVIHDFNNLLTIININTELALKDVPEGARPHDNLEEIRKAGDRAASLNRQLLAFIRRRILVPKLLNLNVVVEEMHSMLRRVIGEDIELALVLEPELGRVEADPGQMEQIIMNLAVNARDAMPSGGRLAVKTENVEITEDTSPLHRSVPPGSYVMLSVADTGVGMDEDTRSQIFQPFFTTKENGKGTGLGLSTVFGIVQQSGGHILVDSQVGRGSTFMAYFPGMEAGHRVEGVDAKAGLGEQHAWETVLVVEDQDQVRQLIRRVLHADGYHVLEAPCGEEAIQICRRYPGPIHLTITDVVMPGMSGHDVASRLTALRPGMKLLYTSGYARDAGAQGGALNQSVPFLPKPFTPETLTRRVREALNQSAATPR